MKRLLMVLAVLTLMVAFGSNLNHSTIKQANWFPPDPLSTLM